MCSSYQCNRPKSERKCNDIAQRRINTSLCENCSLFSCPTRALEKDSRNGHAYMQYKCTWSCVAVDSSKLSTPHGRVNGVKCTRSCLTYRSVNGGVCLWDVHFKLVWQYTSLGFYITKLPPAIFVRTRVEKVEGCTRCVNGVWNV